MTNKCFITKTYLPQVERQLYIYIVSTDGRNINGIQFNKRACILNRKCTIYSQLKINIQKRYNASACILCAMLFKYKQGTHSRRHCLFLRYNGCSRDTVNHNYLHTYKMYSPEISTNFRLAIHQEPYVTLINTSNNHKSIQNTTKSLGFKNNHKNNYTPLGRQTAQRQIYLTLDF